MILLIFTTILAVNAVIVTTDSIAYTTISRTTNKKGNCLSDCMNVECIVNYRLCKKPCVTDGLPAPRYRTSLYEGKVKHCLSNCDYFRYRYLWCFTSENYDWDYCSSSSSRLDSYDYKAKKCTSPCMKKTAYTYFTCDSSTGANTYCAPSATVSTANCNALLFSKHPAIYSNRVIYS